MTAAMVVVAALVLAPGLGAALAFSPPGTISIESRIALTFGLGYASVAGVATLLALAHVFSRLTFIVAVALVTSAVWALALRRAGPHAHASGLVAQAREAPFALAGGLALLLAVAVVWPFHNPDRNLSIRPAWRYWADGLEAASAGHIPTQTEQWGTVIPATVNKVVFNTFEGGVSFLLGADPLAPMHSILIVATVGMVAALLALGRELGLGIFAPLVPALVLLVPTSLPLSHRIANLHGWYTAEGVSRMVGFSAVVAGIYAVRARDSRVPAVVTGVLLAVAGLTHGVAALVAAVMLAFYALAALLLNRGTWRRILWGGAVVVVVAAVGYLGVVGLSGGDLGFQKVSGGEFSAFPRTVDPTRSLAHGELLPPLTKEGSFLIPPREALRRYLDTIFRPGEARLGLLALAILGAMSLVMVLAIRPLLPLAAVAWGLFATILVIALWFSYRYDTWIPGDFGVRRLYGYGVLVPALLVPALLEAMATPLVRRWRIATPALAVGVVVLVVGLAVNQIPRQGPLRRAETGLAVIERVADVVPCDARMLVNWRTTGTWEAMTGRRALTEGMGPFLRPEVLQRALTVLLGANEFFDDPQTNRGFLARERVEYLVVVKRSVQIGTHSGREPQSGDADAIASLPGVSPLVRDRWVSIFAVGSVSTGRDGGQPRRCPV